MEGFYSGEGPLPPEHYHPRQDEHFEVLEGAVRVVINGEERRYRPVRRSTCRRAHRIRWQVPAEAACIGR